MSGPRIAAIVARFDSRLADLAALIAATRARLAAFDGDDALLGREKIISLPGNLGITLDGAAYVEAGLCPISIFTLSPPMRFCAAWA